MRTCAITSCTPGTAAGYRNLHPCHFPRKTTGRGSSICGRRYSNASLSTGFFPFFLQNWAKVSYMMIERDGTRRVAHEHLLVEVPDPFELCILFLKGPDDPEIELGSYTLFICRGPDLEEVVVHGSKPLPELGELLFQALDPLFLFLNDVERIHRKPDLIFVLPPR